MFETDYRLKLLVCSISEIRFVSIKLGPTKGGYERLKWIDLCEPGIFSSYLLVDDADNIHILIY